MGETPRENGGTPDSAGETPAVLETTLARVPRGAGLCPQNGQTPDEAGLLASLTLIGGTCLRGVDLGTLGLILQAESREEILADKIVGLALRENRVKNRDLWDIVWLVQQGVGLPAKLIPIKVHDHQREPAEFAGLLAGRVADLKTKTEMRDDFLREMRRFLPAMTARETVERPAYWAYLTQIVDEQSTRALAALS